MARIAQILTTAKEGRTSNMGFASSEVTYHLEQGGKENTEYGTFLFGQLSKDLTRLYGKEFSRSNFLYMRKLYLNFPKSETLSNVLSWSQYSLPTQLLQHPQIAFRELQSSPAHHLIGRIDGFFQFERFCAFCPAPGKGR